MSLSAIEFSATIERATELCDLGENEAAAALHRTLGDDPKIWDKSDRVRDMAALAARLKLPPEDRLVLVPGAAEAFFNDALHFFEREDFDAAYQAFLKSAALQPDSGCWQNIGMAAKSSGNLSGAEDAYTWALKLDHDNVTARIERSNVWYAMGDHDRANLELEWVLENRGLNAQALLQKGLRAAENNDQETALIAFIKGQHHFPDDLLLAQNTALTLDALKRFTEATEFHQKASEIEPKAPVVWYGLGWNLLMQKRYDEAIDAFRISDELNPQQSATLYNLSLCLRDIGKVKEGLLILQNNAELFTDDAEAQYLEGQMLQSLGHLIDGLEAYERAIAINPEHPRALANIGFIKGVQGDIDLALHYTARAISKYPEQTTARGNQIYFSSYDPKLTAEGAFEVVKQWGDRFAKPLEPEGLKFNSRLDPKRPLKIGFLSPDFRTHVSSHFIQPLFDHLPRSDLTLFLYATHPQKDALTNYYQGIADHWRDLVAYDDDQATEIIRRDSIDILVDLGGQTSDSRLLICARRAAPIQITWLGHGNTSGIPEMDYFLGNSDLVPDGYDHIFSEEILRLPGTFMCYRPWDEAPAVSPLPALENGHITFGSMSRAVRFNPQQLAIWKGIFNQLPDAKLILHTNFFSDPRFANAVKKRFGDAGISAHHLDMRSGHDWWQSYQDTDIVLDCIPQNYGATTFDSLWMGNPVLTLQARPPVGRIGTSILRQLGLDDWITTTPEAYINTAIKKAQNTDALSELRSSLRSRMETSSLRDEPRFAKEMKSLFRGVWTNYCQNPKHLHSEGVS